MTGYLYDPEGERVAKGTITSWSCDPSSNGFQLTASYVRGAGEESLTVLEADGDTLYENVSGAGKLLATYDSNGAHYHVTDPWARGAFRPMRTVFLNWISRSCPSVTV